MRFDEETWRRWVAWIATIKDDLSQTVNDQFVGNEFTRLVQQNSEWIDQHEGGYFVSFVLRSYAVRAAFGVRRHIKDNDDSVSLVRLLGQMQKCAPQIRFDFYLEQFPRKERGPPWQEKVFGQLSDDGKELSSTRIAADLEAVKGTAASVEKFADRSLAHLDKRGFDGEVTWVELNEAIDGFNKLACKYICFMTGSYSDSLRASIAFPWKRIFQSPLVRPEDEPDS